MAEMGNAQPGWGMIEIGAGVGVLTAELAQRADKVVCIEIDSRLLPILDETLAEYDNIKIVNQDVLKVDLHKLIAEEFPNMPVAVCANLPYYITSPIIMNLLESPSANFLPDCYGTKGSSTANLRYAGQPGSRSGFDCCTLLLRTKGPISGFPRLLYASSRRRFHCNPSGYPQATCRGCQKGRGLLPRCQSRFFSAQKNFVQHSFLRSFDEQNTNRRASGTCRRCIQSAC